MTTKEFYEEVKASSICPENFDQIYKEFGKYQKDGIRTLKEFHTICENNGIRYILGYGSLLGAIRDNGAIPWDYDVDVFMPYEEKDKLLAALNTDLSQDYYYESPDNSKDFPSFMIRISPNEYDTLAVHADIFYIIGGSEKEAEQKAMGEQIKKLCLDRAKKLKDFDKLEIRNLQSFLITNIAKLKRIGVSIAKIDRRLETICKQYNPWKTNVSMIVCSVYENVFCYPTNLLWDTELYKTEVGDFRVPKTYDTILKKLYGNYKKPLPLEKRIDEMMHYYRLLKHLDYYHAKDSASGKV